MKKAKHFLTILSITFILSIFFIPASASENIDTNLGGLEDQTGYILPDETIFLPSDAVAASGARNPEGMEYLIVSLNAKAVTNLLTTYNKLSSPKSFTYADISDDGLIYYVWEMTNTRNEDSKAGICYYNSFTGFFEAVHAGYAASGETGISGYIGKSTFNTLRTYYGFVKNENEIGVTSGWLHIYHLDPY